MGVQEVIARIELVGREAEVGAVTAALAQSCTGRPQLIVCQGDPGVGKTRLAEELADRAAQGHVPVLWGRAAETDGAPAYWPWVQVLRSALRDAPARDRAAALGVQSELDVIAGAPGAGPPSTGDPDSRFRLFDAVTRFVAELAADSGLVVVLDDVHWADQPSLLLLRHLAAGLTDQRLLVLVTARTGDPAFGPTSAELLRSPATSRLELSGLSRDAVARLLAAAADRPVTAAEVTRVHELTTGNPFFVAELGRSLDTSTVPTSVRDAVLGRIGRLSTPAVEQVQVAAVLGREFDGTVLAAALDRSLPECRELLAEAIDATVVEPIAAGTYRFSHALVRDAVVAALPAGDRARLHERVAHAVERFADDVEPHLAELARHWAAAGRGEQASHWAELAADSAARGLAYEEAARLYQEALDTAPDLCDDRRYRLLLGLGRARYQSAALADAWSAGRSAARAAERLGRPDLFAEAALVFECTSVAEWDERVRDLCSAALAGLPEPSGTCSTGIRVRLLARLAEAQLWLGELAAAATSSAAAVAAADGEDPQALVAALRSRQLVCSGPDGLHERSVLADRLVALGAELADPATQLCGHRGRIDVQLARGDLAGAAGELEHLSWLTHRVSGPIAHWFRYRYQAVLAQARGEFGTARTAADAGLAAISPLRHLAAFPIRMSPLLGLDHHLGGDPTAEHVLACRQTRPGGSATPGHVYWIMDFLCPATVLAQAGLLEEAAAKFRALGPVPTWATPLEHRLALWAFGVIVGIAVDAADEVAAVRDLLAGYRGQHVVDSANVTLYLGPVELYLGMAAHHLGDLDAAVTELDTAVQACRTAGSRGFAVEAGDELAGALIARGRPADLERAAGLVAQYRPVAEELGMVPYVKDLERLADDLTVRGRPSPLSARELEVAALVARGHTNGRIAAELYISPRTAESHVQHILTKLGLPNRSQVAVWFHERSVGDA